ncbi:MAG: tripartite tricarboxylate transporter substrate binding protein [Betaproteobacteria bacterium]|nr:tripartite tricarboxylate transporter substrate binding protein [Betaproteobacteria bacterium]
MKAERFRLASAACALAIGGMLGSTAYAYPTKPIRFVVTFAPGGGTDIVARAMSQKFTESLGQPVVVENGAGANGNIGTDYVAKSPPDGHTLVMTTNAPIVINPHLYKKLPFNPLTDLAPVSEIASLPFVLAVHPTVPAKTVKELIALAKATPKGLTYGSSGTGGGAHLAGEMVKNMAHINIIHVPYKGGGPAIIGLLSGEVDFMFISILTVTPLLSDKRLRPIAVTSATRNKALPDVPAVSELPLLKGAESDLWYGMLAPANIDRKIIEILANETRRVLALPEFRNRFEPSGTVLVGSSPEVFRARIKDDYERWGKVVKASGTSID